MVFLCLVAISNHFIMKMNDLFSKCVSYRNDCFLFLISLNGFVYAIKCILNSFLNKMIGFLMFGYHFKAFPYEAEKVFYIDN